MATEREVQEMIARGVSLMVYHRNVGKTRAEQAGLAAEARSIARWAEGLGDQGGTVRFLRPLEAELTARYGKDEGRRLLGDFIKASGRVDRAPWVGTPIRMALRPVVV